MKRIKQIIEALKVLSRTPSKTIIQAIAVVSAAATEFAKSQAWTDGSPEAQRFSQSQDLVENIIAAVVLVAEDMEKAPKPTEAAS